jgi:phasin family protein
MNQQFGKQAFEQADKLFKDLHMPGNLQALAEQGVAASRDFFEKTATATQDGTKALTEIADSAWGSTKMLNEKLMQNLAATFTAAHAIATAKSLPEIIKLQSDYIQKLTAQATQQTKEFIDLSTRASQHVFEKAQVTTSRSFKATL